MLHNLPHDKVHLIAGGARSGADLHVRRYAMDFGFKYTTFPDDWVGPYRKGAGFRRNEWMGDVITHLVAFWDFKSPGTKHMIDIANREDKNIIVQVFRVFPQQTRQ